MEPNWEVARSEIEKIYSAVETLEQIFPTRKFTPDGHLVGSLGEVLAAYIFELTLETASNLGFDARSSCGKQVEVKFTQGRTVAFRHQPEHAVVLRKSPRRPLEIIYNGPGSLVWNASGKKGENGQRALSITKAANLMSKVPKGLQLPQVRLSPL